MMFGVPSAGSWSTRAALSVKSLSSSIFQLR
jgi:hypothetical protein